MNRREFVQRAVAVAALPAWAKPLTTNADPAVAKLARALDGDIVTPHSARYDTARLLWDSRYDALRPRAIAFCANVADVRRAVRWSRDQRVHIVPRSGGHSYGGYSSGNGVVIVDVSNLSSVGVTGATATIGAGARLVDVYTQLWQHGVTIPGGSCPGVGIAGLALGGGVGYSSRLLGTTADNVRRIGIVTADGAHRSIDASHDPNLFWACRGGGGGNFGIATSFALATHPVSNVATYEIEWPWAEAAQAVAAWQAFAPHAPDALFSVLDLIAAANGPHVVSGGQFYGSESELASLIQPLAAAGAPTRVRTTTRTYLDAVLHYAGCRDATACTDRRLAFTAKSDYANTPLSAEAITLLVNAIAARSGSAAIYLDAYGGAINRVARGATAFVHRDALFSIQYTAQGSDTAWLETLYAQLRPHVSGFAYQNYIDPRLRDWQRAYYGSNLARLKAVKRAYDQHGLFRFPQAIPAR